jgi:hypothetical protein
MIAVGLALLMSLNLSYGLVRNMNKLGGMSRLHASTMTPLSVPIKLKGAEDLMKKTDVFIFDCDGVIWRGAYLMSLRYLQSSL